MAAETPKISVANVSMLISEGSALSNRDSLWDRQTWDRLKHWDILKFTRIFFVVFFGQTFLDIKKLLGFFGGRTMQMAHSMSSTKTSYTFSCAFI